MRDAVHARKENDKRIKEAADAVRSGSAGKSRAEIRRLLLDEFRARSAEPPPDPRLSLMVDSIARFGEQTARGRTGMARGLASFTGDMTAVFRTFKNDLPFKDGVIVTDPTGREPYYPSQASAPAGLDVLLDEGAERVLDAMNLGQRITEAFGGAQERASAVGQPVLLPVRLETAGAVTETHLAVIAYVGSNRVGELNPDDGAALEQELRKARQQDRSLTMFGSYHRADAGSPARLVLYPRPPRPR